MLGDSMPLSFIKVADTCGCPKTDTIVHSKTIVLIKFLGVSGHYPSMK